MRVKVWLTALFFGGVLIGTTAADPKVKPLKHHKDTAASHETVAVPEPSVLLLSGLGMAGVLVGGWYVRRRELVRKPQR